MAPPTLPGPDETQDDAQWRTAGERIQNLLDASSSGGAVARERAEQLVREVTDLYGAVLERMMVVALAADPDLADQFAADDLVASLLLVHGLHPHDVERRVSDALDSVRPYLGSHGGDVSLLGVDDDVVRLQFQGSCKSCPSSSVTLELAVEDAVRAAAPEISSIEVVAADEDPSSGVIPAESLLTQLHSNRGRGREEQITGTGRRRGSRSRSSPTWRKVRSAASGRGPHGAGLPGGRRRFGERDRWGIYAYVTGVPVAWARWPARNCAVRCCGVRRAAPAFDAVHAGAGVGGDSHLEPIPVLVRDGVLSMAVPEEVA